jgi:hypothetical protein
MGKPFFPDFGLPLLFATLVDGCHGVVLYKSLGNELPS